MKKLCTLLIASMALAPNAFAAGPTPRPTTGSTTTQATIKVAGHVIATVKLAELPPDAEFEIEADSMTYNAETGVSTATGRFTVKVHQGARRLWVLTVENGICTVEQVATAQ